MATRYYTSFVEKRKLYIVMELVDGVTLGSFLSDHANHSYGADSAAIGLPEKLIWQIFLQVRLPLPALVSASTAACAYRCECHAAQRSLQRSAAQLAAQVLDAPES